MSGDRQAGAESTENTTIFRLMASFEGSEEIDDELPLGDGTADTAATVYCPYCNEPVEISLDAGGGGTQEYVEDCQVCCQPWTVSVRYGSDGSASVFVTPLDE